MNSDSTSPMTLTQSANPSLPDIEPGILPVFRLFMGILWGLFTIGLCGPYNAPPDYFNLLSWLFTGFLFFYLSWTWLQKQIGAPYLPIALTLVTVWPILAAAISNVILARQGAPQNPADDAGRLI